MRRKRLLKSLLGASVAIGGTLLLPKIEAAPPAPSLTISKHSLKDAYDILVYREGNEAVAVTREGEIVARSTDHSSVMQEAINYLYNRGVNQQGIIYIAQGEYTGIDIELKSKVWIIGAGFDTVIYGRFKVTQQQEIMVARMRLQTPSDYNAESIYISGGKLLWFKNLKIVNNTADYIAVRINGGTDYAGVIVFDKCMISAWKGGVYIESSDAGKSAHSVWIRDTWIHYLGASHPTNYESGVALKSADGMALNIFLENVYLEKWYYGFSTSQDGYFYVNAWVDNNYIGALIPPAAWTRGYFKAILRSPFSNDYIAVVNGTWYADNGYFEITKDWHGILYLAEPLKVNDDIEFTSSGKGIILIDRTTGTKYRLYVDNGTLALEAV